ncbi:MAG: anti-sigma factor antagonist [Sedimentisphaerales bacterium]|nr:anti-sigma factor antagonist [Sedimentisphaerales bacterium]
MGIRNPSENVIFVTVPCDKLERAEKLKNLNETIGENSQCDVIIDFAGVEIINSWNISNLLILREMLEKAGRKLVLCSVNTATKCIFVVAGLSKTFFFAENKSAALDAIRHTDSSVIANPS